MENIHRKHMASECFLKAILNVRRGSRNNDSNGDKLQNFVSDSHKSDSIAAVVNEDEPSWLPHYS